METQGKSQIPHKILHIGDIVAHWGRGGAHWVQPVYIIEREVERHTSVQL